MSEGAPTDAGAHVATLFVYGTLQLPEVMEAVTGRRFPDSEATLRGYLRRRLEARTYPGIVPREGEETPGRLYRQIDPRSLARLDVFEDRIYDRRRVQARTAGGALVEAWAYVLAEPYAYLLSSEPWDARDFLARHRDAFLQSCKRFREEGVG